MRAPSPTVTVSVTAGHIPPALAPFADAPRWVVWRYGSARKGKAKPPKVPYNPRTGRPADSTDPTTWATFAEASRALQRGRYDGIGIMLGDGLAGIDFDHCVDGVGQIAPAVLADVQALNSYTEFSPSGTGVKVLCLGELPSSWKTDYCEGYSEARFFALTFRQLAGSPDAVQSAPAALAALHARWASKGAAHKQSNNGAPILTPAGLDWSFVAWLEARHSRLLAPSGLPWGCTPQLRVLLERDELPAGLRAKGDSPSERRALVVRQLARAGYLPEELYVLARLLWQRHSYASKNARDTLADLLRLITLEARPNAYSLHSQARLAEYLRKPTPTPASPPAEALAPATPRRAPADLAAYLVALTEAAECGVVLLTRAERAQLVGIHSKTAQRLETRLVAEGAIRLTKPVRTATGRAVYVQILKRIIEPVAPDVHTPPAQPAPTPQTDDATAYALGEDTVCPLVPPAAEPAPGAPVLPPTHTQPVSSPSGRPALAELVAEALDAYGTAGGKAVLCRVQAHVRTVGGLRCTDAAICRAYRAELQRRKYARADAALRATAENKGPTWRRQRLRGLEHSIVGDLALAASLRQQPYRLDLVTGDVTTERRSDKTPGQLEARVWVWARQYAIIAQVHEERQAPISPETEEEALLDEAVAVLAQLRAQAVARGEAPRRPQVDVQQAAPKPVPVPAKTPSAAAGLVARLKARQQQIALCAD